MAEFCNKCSNEMFGNDVKADINVPEIFEKLEEGYMEDGFICEGCGMVLIAKIGNQMIVGKVSYSEDGARDYVENFENVKNYS
jgi:hypothetical protein